MDDLDKIAIRFHFGGSFQNIGGNSYYVGGDSAESWFDVDKLSYFEIKGHLADHFRTDSIVRLYWVKPEFNVWDGLVMLVDDALCQVMLQHHRGGLMVDIYVEEVGMEVSADDQDICAGKEEADGEQVAVDEGLDDNAKGLHDNVEGLDDNGGGDDEVHISDDSLDSDYVQPLDEDSSADDEEAEEMRKFAYEIKRKAVAKKLGIHGSQVGETRVEDMVQEVPNLEEPDSPYADSNDDYSYDENSDGESVRWKSVENRYDSKAPIPVFSLGMAFRDKMQFKKALLKYGLKTHRHLRFDKDEKKKVKAVCTWPGCKWLIYGSISTRSEWMKVVTFVDVHTCPPRRDNKLVTSSLIAKHYHQEIKDNPTWKAGQMQIRVLKDFIADVSVSKCKRAKAIVMKEALNGLKGEYSRVYDYQMELLRTNPGSTVVVTLDPEIEDKKVFERMYVCFDACKKGFMAGCRKVIGLDGCWFKGAHNGNLLCAIGRDANNQMYPVAWAAVPIECYDTWYWFIGLLQKDLNINNGGEDWVIISDQQKGLLKAVKELVPNAEHRMCARHIYANWRKKYTDKKLQKKWWRCAKASCRPMFNLYKAYLAQDTPDGAKDMMSTSPEHWSRAFFRLGSNCDSVDNNMCESFNNSIMDARFYPVISMMEAIRKKIMVRIQENRTKAERWIGTICPNIFRKLKINIERSGCCVVLWNGANGFEVQEKEDRKYVVNLQQRTCTCRYWQLSGLPCCHAISCIYKASKLMDDYIASCYSIVEYHKTYAYVLQPIEGPGNWPISDMPRPDPPAYVKMPGRPKTERKREVGEEPKGTKLSRVGLKMRCRLCGKDDHNARRCPKNPEAGNKANAHIKRAKTKNRKAAEKSTDDGTASKRTKAYHEMPSARQAISVDAGPSQPIPSQDHPSQSASHGPSQHRPSQYGSHGLGQGRPSQAATHGRSQGRPSQPATHGRSHGRPSQPATHGRSHGRPRGARTGTGRLQHLIFGDNY